MISATQKPLYSEHKPIFTYTYYTHKFCLDNYTQASWESFKMLSIENCRNAWGDYIPSAHLQPICKCMYIKRPIYIHTYRVWSGAAFALALENPLIGLSGNHL